MSTVSRIANDFDKIFPFVNDRAKAFIGRALLDILCKKCISQDLFGQCGGCSEHDEIRALFLEEK